SVYEAPYGLNDDISIRFFLAFDDSNALEIFLVEPVPVLAEETATDYDSNVTFELPFEGLWYAIWGGEGILYNAHASSPPQRYAYDLVVWQDGSTFSGDGTQNSDYHVYGQPIFAPASGEVIRAVNDIPENVPQ